MSIINVNNLSKTYKIHEKQEGLKNTIKDLFNRKYVYKDAVNNLNMAIDELWTAPEFRRKGIAKALMQKAFELQKEMGAVKLRLYTQDDNTTSQSLYRRFGFKTNGKAVFMEAD
ncbi:MAG TPA: GNAT family N-acetyltransferase [Clostridiaceae bacterium]|nr:GNAT family N-acetyltransferase [Clostridiaceae bacterium]